MFERLEIGALVNMTRCQMLLMMLGTSLIIYLYQMWQEGNDLEVHIGPRRRAKG